MCSVFVLKDQDYNSNMIDYRRDKVKRRYYDERYLQVIEDVEGYKITTSPTD